MKKLITIGIPAYNRARELNLLLDSIEPQYSSDVEVLVIEDCSPERLAIREVINNHLLPVNYIENDINLGVDGNLRNIVNNASGEYILFMGNDDLLVIDALDYYRKIISDNANNDLAIIVKAYQEYDNERSVATRAIKYVSRDTLLNPSEESSAFIFRRSVAIMGMCYKTSLAKSLDTSRYDGSIYYHLWLSGNLALKHRVLVSSKVTALRRCGMSPDFGNAESEKNAVVGHYYSSAAFANYVSNMMRIASDVAQLNNADKFYTLVLNDFRNYSYPFLAPVRPNGVREFLQHYTRMKNTGVGYGLMFNFYFIVLLLLGRGVSDKLLTCAGALLKTTAVFWRVKHNAIVQ